MSLIIVLLIGVVIGMLVSRFIFREKPVGSLRVDESDPDSGPYLFLECQILRCLRTIICLL